MNYILSYRKAVMSFALSCLCVLCAFSQQLTVNGIVKDSNGEAVIGASVVVEGTTNGSITDLDGAFTLQNVPSNANLSVSYIGYKTQVIPVNGKTTFNVVLQSDSELLDEVVVVGYGVQRKSDLTGSVASVKATDALKTMPTGNVSDALQGRMAGVSVLSGSGDPSQDNTIRVRGINSITAETGPLVVVDGFIGGSLQNLNPSDIASIEVLKDASATAVYGSRGANGVILVTTKNPGEGKMMVNFNAFANIKTVAKYPDTMSPYDYAVMVNEYGNDIGHGDYFDATQLADLQAGRAGYDYSREIFRTAVTQNYDLSISGGNEKTKFLASFRYQNDQGVLQKSMSETYNWRLKVDTKIKKWLEVGLNFYGNYRKSSSPRVNAYRGIFQSAMYFDNTMSPKDENGEYNNSNWNGDNMYNPMGHIWELDSETQTINNRLQGYVQFNIVDGLTFRSQMGVLFDNRLATTLENEDSYQMWAQSQPRAYARSYFNLSWLNTNTLSYVKEFNEDHRINATAVFEQSYDNNYNHLGRAYWPDYTDITHGYNNLAMSQNATLNELESDRTITTLMSGMLRLNYVFKNRYMITASIRADGSSRLEDKWAYFPSAALAWDMKQENFLKNVNFIDQLKLRVGYGSVGNQSVEAYRIYSMMTPVRGSDGRTTYAVDRPNSPYLKWERNDQFNVGIDFSVLNGRLRLTADWYNKLSKDILLEVAQPTHMGYGSLLRNAGEIKNTGVEFTISADPFVSNDPTGFSWHTDLTLSHNKGTFNKIPTFNHRQQQAGNYQNELFQMVEGEKLGSFWGYTFEGLWQQADVDALFVDAEGNTDGRTNGEVYGVVAGNSKYTDVNKDGVLNSDDQNIIGSGQPTFNWGWSNTFSYKNFDLSFFLVGFHGFDIYNATHQIGFNAINSQQTAPITPMKDWLNHWTPENTNTDVPRWDGEGTKNKGMYSTRFVENGSFIKMKSITLGYTIPQQICQKWGITNLRIYASVQNPFHITGYSGLDPEATLGDPLIQGVDWGNYPNSRNYLIGLNFAF
ncbi:SusC/RagA family TonB-linked outer membrane protein [Bacteroides sp. ET225]|uniref:SusC/RagA family TonB-linked outer membrane protein n=1 Tax=Bacteroides sp. ET225 TaxID=2972461 RepID=UPI0035C8FB5C